MSAAESTPETELQAGEQVGEYRIEGKLGEGGFGAVYRAVHPLIGKPAAIKVLNREYSANPDMVSRFVDEARAVNQIRHRHIIDIFSFGALEDGRQFFVMELLDGHTLEAHIKSHGPIEPGAALRILKPVAKALSAAHAAGIAHRDLKPENIFLTFDDEGQVFPKLLDFGIAKLMGESERMSSKTRTGTPMGTPLYMSPEQCRGKNVDHRTDIYSFGIVAYEMLAGRVPFDGETVIDVMLAQTAKDAVPPSQVNPALSSAFDAPLLALLDKEPDRRPTPITAAFDALLEAARPLGLSVPSAIGGAASSGRGIPPTLGEAVSRPNLTPDQAKLAEAHTIAGADSAPIVRAGPEDVTQPALDAAAPRVEVAKTFQGAEADVPAGGSKRTAVVIGVAALLVGVVAAVVMVSGQTPAPEPSAAAAQPESVPDPNDKAEPDAMPSAEQPDEVAPTVAAAEAVQPEAKVVELTIQSSLDAVEVFRDNERLGDSSGPIELERGDAAVKLSIRKPGFIPKEVEVTPSANIVLPVDLKRLPNPSHTNPNPVPPPISDELDF